MSLDVADAAAVRAMVDDATADGTPLRGVVHAAGVVDDGLLGGLTSERFAAVRRPKVDGARNLLAAADPHHPDHVVLFAAGAGLFGPAGQANYAAANAELDALAHARRAVGLPAQAIDWGPWAGVGHGRPRRGCHPPVGGPGRGCARAHGGPGRVPRRSSHRARCRSRCSSCGGRRCCTTTPSTASRRSCRAWCAPPSGAVADDGGSAPVTDLAEELQGVAPERRRDHLATRTREQVLRVLGLDPAHPVGPHQGLTDLGMDSLMTVELSNRLSALVNRSLPSTVAFEYPTLDELTTHLQQLLSDRVEFPAAAARAPEPDLLAGLDEAELTDALLKELDDAGY